MTTISTSDIAGAGLTFGSIVKVGLVEWGMCEILILAFLLVRGIPKNNFAVEINGSTLATGGSLVGDFVVLSLMAFGAVTVLSLCLFLGQQLFGPFLSLNLRLITRP